MVTHTTPEVIQEFIRLYKAGTPVAAISVSTGFSQFTIHKHIKRAGLSRYAPRLPHILNECAFDVLTPEALYWLGLLVTDGCVCGGKRIKLGLGRVDKDTVEKFKEFMRYDGPVEFDKSNNSFGIRFTSLRIAQLLIPHGLTTRKSFTVVVSAECCTSEHFWRGAFEGDGGIAESGVLTFTSASQAFAQQYCDFLNINIPGLQAHVRPRIGTRLYDVRNGDNEATKIILDLLYRGASWRMPRKYSGQMNIEAREVTTPMHSDFYKRTRAGRVVISREEIAEFLLADRQGRVQKSLPWALRITEITPPLRTCTYSEAVSDFYRLQRLDTSTLWDDNADWTMKIEMGQYQKVGRLHRKIAGQAASDVWQVGERWRARYIYDPSPWFRWHDQYYVAGVIRNLISTGAREITLAHMRAGILRQGYTPAQFPPSVAKAVINRLGAVSVVDPFAGWGDRLVGFLASDAQRYYGVDNNPALQFGYEKAMLYNPVKSASIDCLDSLTVKTWPESDLVFTSPPYAHYEQYRCAKSPVIDASTWVVNFLCPILRSCCVSLRPGGHMVIHIGNVRVRRTVLYLVNDVLSGVSWMRHVGMWGVYGDGKRATHAEPLLVWRKDA